MRMEIERVFLRVEARRAQKVARDSGVRCPNGCAAILANDTPILERWDEVLLEQWRVRHGLSGIVASDIPRSDPSACGVGG